jgi:hypothetical protein
MKHVTGSQSVMQTPVQFALEISRAGLGAAPARPVRPRAPAATSIEVVTPILLVITLSP